MQLSRLNVGTYNKTAIVIWLVDYTIIVVCVYYLMTDSRAYPYTEL